ncbi:MAG: hypothetical protein ACXVA9_03750 [Bdellovibrionales bacterium]
MRMVVLCIFILSSTAFAELDQYQKTGLQQTQGLLRDSKTRDEAVRKDPKAADVDRKTELLTGSKENKDATYDLAAQLIEKIAIEADGDPSKMQEMMKEAQSNPEAFYKKYFDEGQKAKVRDIANKAKGTGPALNNK